jgi:predicted outer membrane repeat protein
MPRLSRATLLAAAFSLLTASVLHAQATAPPVALATTAIGATTTGTVTFTFTTSTAVASINIVTQGTPSLDFTPNAAAPGTCTATTYTTGTCTVGVKFTPLAAGPRAGAVVLRDSSSNVLGVGLLSGIGSGAAFVTSTGPVAEIPGGGGLAATTDFVDAAGNVYTTAENQQLINKTTPAGVVTTVISASAAPYPQGIVVDGAGYAYVASTTNNAIYKVDQVTGTTTTFASGFGALKAIAIDSLGNLYASDSSGACVIDEITPAGAMSTLVSTGCTNYAINIAVDSAGNVYWAAPTPGSIFKYSPATTTTTTVNTGGAISGAHSVAVDAAGNLYVANFTANLYVIPAGATSATLLASTVASSIIDIALDGAGNLYFGATSGSDNMYKMDRTHPTASPTGATATGSHSSEFTSTYVNDGNAAAAITGSTIVAPAIVGPSTTCTASNSVAVLGTCVDGIEFAPTAHGSPQSGTVTLAGALTSPVYTITGYVAGDPEKLGFGTAPPAGITAGGNAGTVTVQVQDNGGTLVTGNTTSITLQITGPGSYTFSCTVAAVNGTATFNLANTSTCSTAATLTTAGTYTYAASATSLTGVSTIEGVSPAATTHFTVTPSSTSLNAGVADNLTVTAYDTYGNVGTNYTGTVKLTSTDTAATLPPNFTLSSGTATTSVTFYTAGTQTVTATDTVTASITGTSASITVAAVPVYMVTVGGDDGTAAAANCNNISMGATANSGCYLRDAIAAAAAAASGSMVPVVLFKSTLYGTTITLTAAVSVSGNIALIGPTAPNIITIKGNSSFGFLTQTAAATTNLSNLIFTGFSATSGGVLSASVSGNTVNLTNDQFLTNTTTSDGGAVYSTTGTLNITGCTFSGNTTGVYGGALYADNDTVNIYSSTFGGTGTVGTSTGGNTANTAGGAIYIVAANTSYVFKMFDSLIVGNLTGTPSVNGSGGGVYTSGETGSFYDSTFTLNTATGASASTGGGGALYQAGSTTNYFYNVTVTNNTAKYRGGGVYKASGTLLVYNSIIEGNASTAGTYPDLNTAPSGSPGSLISTSTSATTNPLLSALGNYGGPTLSIIPLPGSPALRYASSVSTSCIDTGSQTVDQRGYPRVLNGVCGGTGVYIDAGATQSSYALAFTQQPLNGLTAANLSPAPTVQVYESGVPFNATPAAVASPGTLVLSNSAGTPTTLTGVLANSGLDTLTVNFPANQTAETLTASITNGSTTTIATVTSNPFNIVTNYIWVINGSGTVDKTTGTSSLGTSTNTANTTNATLGGMAFDAAGTAWSVSNSSNTLEATPYGVTTTSTYTGGGLNMPVSVAVDGNGFIWIANSANNSISAFNNSGVAQSGTSGYNGVGVFSSGTTADFSAPSAIVLDNTGGVWVTNKTGNSLTHVFTGAAPVVTPLSTAVTNSTLGSKP